MTTMRVLNELIKDEARISIMNEFGKNFCVLDEPNCPGCRLKIVNLPDSAIIIKADMFPAPKDIFKGNKMESKRADYIIVVDEPKKRVLYIELKQSNRSAKPTEVVAQLKGAKCLMDYCKSIALEFWKECDFLQGFEPRYFKYYVKTLDKRPTRIDTNSSQHNLPEKAKILSEKERIELNKLLG